MKKILVIIIGVLATSSFSATRFENSSELITRHFNAESRQAEGLSYLNSFDDVELDINSLDATFNATKKIKSLAGVELLNESEYSSDNSFVSFEATFVQEVGIFFMKVTLNNEFTVIDQINVIGYPFFNESLGENDIRFEYFGEKLLASDVLNRAVDNQLISSNRFFMLMDVDGGGGGSSGSGGNNSNTTVNVTMPVLQISTAIINSGRNYVQEGINNLEKIAPVDFWRDGPLHYLLWYVKTEKVVANYRHNKTLSIPAGVLKDGYINSQSQFTDWKFGFESLNNNGCGIISIYNLLVSQGRTTELPSLILLGELMNADLGLGFLGLNPITNDLMKLVSNTVNIIFKVMQPLLHLASPVIAGVITERLISDQLDRSNRWWQDMLIWASMPGQYAITLAAVNTAIVAAVAAFDLVTDFYLEHLHGIPDVLKVLGYESLDVSYLSYDNFNSGRNTYGYFIITFFNKIPNFSNLESFSAHTIFVKRDRQNESAMTAYNNGYDNKFSTFYQFYTSNYDNRNTQFISGVTIKG